MLICWQQDWSQTPTSASAAVQTAVHATCSLAPPSDVVIVAAKLTWALSATMADPSTLSNCLEVAVTSWHLSLDADFTTKKLTGAVTLHGRVLADNLDRIVSELTQ